MESGCTREQFWNHRIHEPCPQSLTLSPIATIMNVPHDVYDRILEEIESAQSPVGIDAKKTHIIILHKLMEIERRLTRIEQALRIGD